MSLGVNTGGREFGGLSAPRTVLCVLLACGSPRVRTRVQEEKGDSGPGPPHSSLGAWGRALAVSCTVSP